MSWKEFNKATTSKIIITIVLALITLFTPIISFGGIAGWGGGNFIPLIVVYFGWSFIIPSLLVTFLVTLALTLVHVVIVYLIVCSVFWIFRKK